MRMRKVVLEIEYDLDALLERNGNLCMAQLRREEPQPSLIEEVVFDTYDCVSLAHLIRKALNQMDIAIERLL
jgi:hypothetical protein